ncbi:sensor histidine kinase [Ottowia oryzae]|uniref:histidine kinase n=2 Tax=Ottowia oryzae TaxID=2109914 RepID=A0A2S0MGN0_9BURK|nr:sensor histidine kinase [Ottowia oryzae]
MRLHAMTSLRVRLVLWLLLPLSLLVALCGWLSWRNAASVADYVQDHDLLASAKVLSDRLIWEDNDVRASVPPAALSLFVSPAHDQVFLSVIGTDGQVLAGKADFPLPQPLALRGPDRAQWYDTALQGLPMRAVVTRRAMYEAGGAREITIAVAKTTRSRDQMLQTLWRPTMEYLLLALLLAVVLSTVALTWELRPIVRLNRQLAARDPLQQDLALDPRGLHNELRPLTDTVNAFARQLRAHSQAQRRFIADAAHQLRTPLALQASQIEFARYTRAHRQDWDTRRADMDAMWQQMASSNQRLIAVSNQLLLLAQAEQDEAHHHLTPLDLGAAALAAVEELAALADKRHIDLGMDLPAEGARVHILAQAALLDALVVNLIDNALRYTPEGGRVTIGVRQAGNVAELTVDDNGPGIAAEARERVFERFYRGEHTATPGSGLGLAIVREVARAFGAEVSLSGHADGNTGLRVTVRFHAPGPHEADEAAAPAVG